jgi:hypothetical protein
MAARFLRAPPGLSGLGRTERNEGNRIRENTSRKELAPPGRHAVITSGRGLRNNQTMVLIDTLVSASSICRVSDRQSVQGFGEGPAPAGPNARSAACDLARRTGKPQCTTAALLLPELRWKGLSYGSRGYPRDFQPSRPPLRNLIRRIPIARARCSTARLV